MKEESKPTLLMSYWKTKHRQNSIKKWYLDSLKLSNSMVVKHFAVMRQIIHGDMKKAFYIFSDLIYDDMQYYDYHGFGYVWRDNREYFGDMFDLKLFKIVYGQELNSPPKMSEEYKKREKQALIPELPKKTVYHESGYKIGYTKSGKRQRADIVEYMHRYKNGKEHLIEHYVSRKTGRFLAKKKPVVKK